MKNKTLCSFLVLFIFITACGLAPLTPLPTPTSGNQSTSRITPPPNCRPSPIIKPTMPAVIPGFAQLDESTGLHMTGSPKDISLAGYQLKVDGKVSHPLALTYDELRCMPKITTKTTLVCKGNFEDVATWAGVPLKYILDLAALQPDAKDVLLIGADKYEAYLSVKDALLPDNFLAYEWNDQPLPILHGFPLRAVMPTMFGAKWTKWLLEITVE
jgi:DMSO/TMAO reductase YedYZ molybdopterin-dependent catalytic subunit